MPTRWTQSLIPTLRNVPAEAEVPSHQLMLRAGYIRKIGAGVYDYLPLGLRSLQKAMAIVRQEMNAAGAIEVLLPTLQPIELWEQTGRRTAYGDNLFVVKDRHGKDFALGPTHEEVITELVSGCIESYRQLPVCLFQIQTKFRDEFRPRFGVLRSREFQMKDAYSFHTQLEGPGGLNETYDKQFTAYCRIFQRCGLPYETVEAEAGPIGGSASHEFMVPSPTGEDTILKSNQGNYAANVEKCEIGPRGVGARFADCCVAGQSVTPTLPDAEPKGVLEKVPTPGCAAIQDVCKLMKVKARHMLKALVFAVTPATDTDAGPTSEAPAALPAYVLVMVRGDHDANEGKINRLVSHRLGVAVTLTMADDQPARAAGWSLGYVGPHAMVGRSDTLMLIDADAAMDQFWACGANEADHHVKAFDWQRDLMARLDAAGRSRVMVAEVRNAVAGDPSPKNDGGVLETTRGIEIGHVFKLGTKYTRAMNVTVLDEKNQRVPILMGCYGIGVNRILAAAIERQGGHDENGIIWPASLAPYHVLITPIRYEGAMKDAADQLACDLESRAVAPPVYQGGACMPGIEVLIDDRDERPGVKFKDADLVGIPVRITIGDKALASGQVEIKLRNAPAGSQPELVPLADVATRIADLLASCQG